MNMTELLMTFRHILLYLCTLGISWLLAGFGPASALSLLTILTLLISSYCDRKAKQLKFVPLLLMALLFLPYFSGLGILSKTVPIIYVSARIFADIHGMSYDQTRSEALAGTAVYAAVALFSSLENASAFFSLTLPVFLLWLALITFMLRLLKNPELQNDRQYLLFSSGISLAMLGIIWALLSETFADFLKKAVTFVYQKILLQPILLFLKGVTWLLRTIYDLFAGFSVSHSEAENPFEGFFEEIGSYNEHYEFFYTEHTDTTWLMILVRVIAVLIVILAAWLIIRHMKKRRTREESGLSFTKESTRPHRRRHDDRDPSSRIRTLYRKYLQLVQKYQIRADGSDASDVIAAKTDAMLKSHDASELRQLWLPVRYGNGSDEDVHRAEELYRSVRKQFREL